MSQNLVGNPSFAGAPDGWTFAAPRDEIAPEHSVRDTPRGRGDRPALSSQAHRSAQSSQVHRPALSSEAYRRALVISATGDKHAFGCWRGELKLEQGEWYRATVKVRIKDVAEPTLSVFAQAADHFLVPREPWAEETVLEQVFKQTAGEHFEVYLRCAETGEVEFCEPCVEKIEKPNTRIVRVATVRFGEPAKKLNLDDQRDRIAEKLDQAGAIGADIVCLPEFCSVTHVAQSVFGTWAGAAEEAPGGPTCCVLSAKAREYGMYVIAGIVRRDGKHIFNAAVIFDRRGELVGEYRKTHPMFAEQQLGISSGDGYPVFDLDFGRIAIHICYDEWFPEVSRYYAHAGAEILFLPVVGGKPITWRTRALDNAIYFVSSAVNPPSMIIDSSGGIIAETHSDGVVYADLDLDYRKVNWYVDPTLSYSMPCRVPQMRTVTDHRLIDDLHKLMREAYK